MAVTQREHYVESIKRRLAWFATQIELDNRENRTDINSEAEDFFCSFLNTLWGTDFHNLNLDDAYSQGADLCNGDKSAVVQISSDGSKRKIESSLAGSALHFSGCRFIFLCLKMNRRPSGSIAVPESLSFDIEHDFYDIEKLVSDVRKSSDEVVERIYRLCHEQLYPEDTLKLTTALGAVVRALAQ